MRNVLTRVVLLIAVLGCACGISVAAAADVESDVRAATASGARARVMVFLQGIEPERLTTEPAAVQGMLDEVIALAANRVLAADLKVERRFATVPAFAATLNAAGLDALDALDAPLRIGLDGGGSGGLTVSLPLARITPVQQAGFSGAGQKVAIIDSGIRLDHQSFTGRIVGEACFCSPNCCPNGQATQFGAGAAADNHGHGTHVAGITAGGTGVAGVPAGAAPAASLVVVKVLDQNNSFCCSSDVVAAMDWVRVNHPDAVVANMSLGTGARFAGDCDAAVAFTQALATAVNGLRSVGTLATVSSGNNGSSVDMQAPACAANALAVGAVYKADVGPRTFGAVCTDATTAADQVTCFSNLSTTTDVLAPGAPIVAAGFASPTASVTFSGTSMAAPTVAGCIALLNQAVPTATPAQIEAAIEASTTRLLRPPMMQSYPRLNCFDALGLLSGLVFRNGFEP